MHEFLENCAGIFTYVDALLAKLLPGFLID
jgi:hypothetical protein